MNILVLGAGMMGQAITFDLLKFSNFNKIKIVDINKSALFSAKKILKNKILDFDILDVKNKDNINKDFKKSDVVISAIPYYLNYYLTKLAIENKSNFIDLGGNNNIVKKQKSLYKQAKKNNVTIIPDCGLAPGLVSVITREIVESFDKVNSVKIRVGGLPIKPKPPFDYQFVFSPNGLINEYVEDAIVLDHGTIKKKKSMTEIETITFPQPFGKMEAFVTSGGCSTLPYNYKDRIDYLDYKTIRYNGHCEKFNVLLKIGLGSDKQIRVGNTKIIPREILISLLKKYIPNEGKDVVLLKVFGEGLKNGKKKKIEYTMIDYCDQENNISAMMRTTGYPVSIIAQLIEKEIINDYGVFTSEEIVPTNIFFSELKKRNINVNKEIKI